MAKFEIEIYYDHKDNSAIGDWLEQIEEKIHTKTNRILYRKIRHLFSLVEEFGPSLSMPDNRKLEDIDSPPIWELRVTGPIDYRIFWTLWKGSVLLLHWIKKDTNKTPAREIKKCQSLYYDWINRYGND